MLDNNQDVLAKKSSHEPLMIIDEEIDYKENSYEDIYLPISSQRAGSALEEETKGSALRSCSLQ